MKKIYTLIMIFKTEAGKNFNISLRNIKKDLTEEEIQATMQTIIDNNLFVNDNGALISSVNAKIVERTTTEFEVA